MDKAFNLDLSVEKQTIYRLIDIEAFLVLFGIVIFSAFPQLRLMSLFTAALSLILILVIGWRLNLRYKRLPIIQEKGTLLSRKPEIELAIQENIIKRNESSTRRRGIAQSEADQLRQQQAKFNQIYGDLQKAFEKISQDETRAQSNLLARIQNAYIAAELKKYLIKDASIPGIGPKLKDLLRENGITNAADVSFDRVLNLPGFGDAKARAVSYWHLTTENRVKTTAPTLTIEQEAAIREKHDRLRTQNRDQVKIEQQKHNTDLEQIRRDAAAQMKAEESQAEDLAREGLNLSDELKLITARLNELKDLTWWQYVRAMMPANPAKKLLTPGLFMALGAMTILFQIGMTFSSSAAVVIASIPTSTLTPTPTLTPTRTPTVTLTPTATNTQTPTVTLTSTVTLTPTITLTPTKTIIPTSTRWPTLTPAPTSTRWPTIDPLLLPPAAPAAPAGNMPGTTGQCRDGTYTSAQHRQGACSWHGGIASWWGP
jgi:hypothetical protein